MRILLLADLHSDHVWCDWLVQQARLFDLVCVAGDLLDMFAADEAGQIDYLRKRWLPAMIHTGVLLALCSGNHGQPAITRLRT